MLHRFYVCQEPALSAVLAEHLLSVPLHRDVKASASKMVAPTGSHSQGKGELMFVTHDHMMVMLKTCFVMFTFCFVIE